MDFVSRNEIPRTPRAALSFPAGSRIRSEGAWLAAALVLLSIMALPSLLYPFGRDQAMFAYIADRWLHGALPYRDAWDIKPAGVFLVYAVAQLCFGRTMAAARWADWLAVLMTASFLYAIVRRSSSAGCACLAAILYGFAYYLSFSYWDTAQAESFAAPLAALLVYALLRVSDSSTGVSQGRDTASNHPRAPLSRSGLCWWIAAGCCLGGLILVKTTFVLFTALPLLAFYKIRTSPTRRERSCLGLAACAVCTLAPFCLAALYFVLNHAGPAFIELFAAQAGYARGQHVGLFSRFGNAWLMLLSHPALILCSIAAGYAHCSSRHRACPDFHLLLLWLALSIGLVIGQGRLYSYHWLPVLPPLVILACRPLVSSWEQVRQSRVFLVRAAATALLLLALLFPAAVAVPRFLQASKAATRKVTKFDYWAEFNGSSGYSTQDNIRVADYVRAHTRAEDTILTLAFEPELYFLSNRAAPTRHLSTAPLISETQIPLSLRRRWQEEQVRDVKASPPALLILTDGIIRLDALHYEENNVVEFAGKHYQGVAHYGQLEIYRRQE